MNKSIIYSWLFSACVVGALLGFGSNLASAQSVPPTFTPNPPVSGVPIIYSQRFLRCPPQGPNVEGDSFWIIQEGQDIHLFVVFLSVPCILPPPGPAAEFNIGPLSAGDYTLFQYRVTPNTTFPVDPDDFEPDFELDFTVGIGTRPVPGLSNVGIALLMILLLGFAGWRLASPRLSK